MSTGTDLTKDIYKTYEEKERELVGQILRFILTTHKREVSSFQLEMQRDESSSLSKKFQTIGCNRGLFCCSLQRVQFSKLVSSRNVLQGCLFIFTDKIIYTPAENSQGGNFGRSDAEHGAVREDMASGGDKY